MTQITLERNGQPRTKKAFRMVALDLDGTLLHKNHKIDDVQAEYLRYLYSRGITICFATGRAQPSVYEHVKKLNLPDPLPVVCSNGARGVSIDSSLSEMKELFYNPVPRSIVDRTLRLASKYGFAIQYYHGDSIYCHCTTPLHETLVSQYMFLAGVPVHSQKDNFKSLLDGDKLPSKLLVLFDDSQLGYALEVYRKEFPQSSQEATVVAGSFDWFLEVLHPDVTKGHGLQELCRTLSVDMDECIAMGDADNDVEFVQMAGLGYAMKNAKEVVKEHADATLPWTNDDRGVMRALQRLEEEGRLLVDNKLG